MPIDLAQSSKRPVDALTELMTDPQTGLPADALADSLADLLADLLVGGGADTPSTCDAAR